VGGAALALLYLAGHASAAIIISNHPGNDGTQSAGINDSDRTKGMAWTMPSGDGYYLDSLLLRLNIDDVNIVPRVEIFSNVGGAPGVSLITLNNPDAFAFGVDDYLFKPPSQFVLEADTTYWWVASSLVGDYDIMASNPAETPTGLATHFGASWGTYPPSNPSSIFSTYELEGRLVPLPGSLALLGLGGLALRRRR
jgi:hypothetical protein